MKIPFSFLIGKKLRKQSASIIAVLGIILILSGEHLQPSLHFIYLGAALIAWSVANDVTWRGLRYISKGRTPAVMMSYLTCAYGVACVVKAGDPVFWRPMARWTWPIVLFSGLFGIFEIVAVMLARYRTARECLLCNCKKIDDAQEIENLQTYAKKGAEYLRILGFNEKFCKM
ncbi:MAG: hypothetical protein IJH61_04685, partial [Eubacteriaceae bacterium]|nr:hypothetical protein [Eubacteriaceae bacterium]